MLLSLITSIIIAAIFSGSTLFLLHSGSQPVELFTPQTLSIIIIGYLLTSLLTAIAQCKICTGQKQGNLASKPASAVNREQGVVKWFNVNKGFGFITQQNGDDIFVHYRSIRGHGRKKLLDGQTVTYTIIDSDRGLQADDVDVSD